MDNFEENERVSLDLIVLKMKRNVAEHVWTKMTMSIKSRNDQTIFLRRRNPTCDGSLNLLKESISSSSSLVAVDFFDECFVDDDLSKKIAVLHESELRISNTFFLSWILVFL